MTSDRLMTNKLKHQNDSLALIMLLHEDFISDKVMESMR